jgi:hypothetical protein
MTTLVLTPHRGFQPDGKPYLTTRGVRPSEDPRRPAIHALGLGRGAGEIMGAVAEKLRRAGYSSREVTSYRVQAMMGDHDNLLAVSHEWCNFTGGTYTEKVYTGEGGETALRVSDTGEATEYTEYDYVEIEVFTCGLCGHEERSEHGTMDECMGCGFCHDCCDCGEDYDDE